MNRLITFAGLLAFTMQAWGAAQWQNISYSTNPVTYTIITNLLGFTGSTATYLRSDGTQATPAGGAVMSGTVSNDVASAGLLSVDATKTNGIAATSSHVTTALGFVPQTGSVNLTNWSGVATNTFADGITNAAKAYTDSTTNKITYGAVTNALAATGSSADVLLGNGNWGVVAFANLTNGLAAPNDTGVFLNGKGLWSVPPGGAYAVTNYFITPSTGITVATNVTGTNVTWTISSTATRTETLQLGQAWKKVDGAGCTLPQTYDYTAEHFMEPLFSGTGTTNANFVRFGVQVPSIINTSQECTANLTIELSDADTGAQTYHIGTACVAASAAANATVGNWIILSIGADASGASGDIETTGSVTLTGWATTLTAGNWWVIELRRDGANDASTVASYLKALTITYGAIN